MQYRNGIDNISSISKLLGNNRLGLITNPTGCDLKLRPTIDILKGNYNLCCLYGPEHGISGAAQAGVKVGNAVDPISGLPVVSMYDKAKAGEEAFSGVDMLIFDIQDVGVRFYTYIYTLSDAMQMCAKAQIPLVVLDRYNPIGLTKTEGTLLDERFSSGVGRFELPSRHAMTVGEYAKYINAEKNFGCELYVCPCEGLDRKADGRTVNAPWIAPSPNMPTLDTAFCYVGTVVFEGTNLSEGRGTTKPFEMIGAPWLRNKEVCDYMNSLRLPGAAFRTADFIPYYSKYNGILCKGLQLHITNYDEFHPFRTGMLLLDYVRRTHEEFEFLYRSKNDVYFIDHLLGSDVYRTAVTDVEAFIEEEQRKVDAFVPRTEKYRIY